MRNIFSLMKENALLSLSVGICLFGVKPQIVQLTEYDPCLYQLSTLYNKKESTDGCVQLLVGGAPFCLTTKYPPFFSKSGDSNCFLFYQEIFL